jgi:Family of unknown function (DUF5677)
MTFADSKAAWQGYAQKLAESAFLIIGECDNFSTLAGRKDPKVLALALLCRTLGHFKGVFRLLEIDLVVDARTLTRCCFENLFWQGELAEKGATFVEAMVHDEVSSQQSRARLVLAWAAEKEGSVPFEEKLKVRMDQLKERYPKKRPINLADVARQSALKDAYVWFKQLSSDAAHPSGSSLARHVTKQDDGSFLISVEPVPIEKEVLDTMQFACQALLGVSVGANQIAGPVKAGEQLAPLFEEFLALAKRDDPAESFHVG